MAYYNFAVIIVDHYNVTHSWNMTAVNPEDVDHLMAKIRETIDTVADARDIGNAHPGTTGVVDETGGF